MDKIEKDVLDASATLAEKIVTARAAGYRVYFQYAGVDPTAVVDGGPEPAPVEAEKPVPAPATFGTRKSDPELSSL